jgi:putative transposase
MSAQKFFNKAIGNNGKPRVINIDKSGSNYSAIRVVNRRNNSVNKIKIRQCKYLNNRFEQDHRNIKRRISICTGFKDFESAQRTLLGIEVVNIIRKNQIIDPRSTCYKHFQIFGRLDKKNPKILELHSINATEPLKLSITEIEVFSFKL